MPHLYSLFALWQYSSSSRWCYAHGLSVRPWVPTLVLSAAKLLPAVLLLHCTYSYLVNESILQQTTQVTTLVLHLLFTYHLSPSNLKNNKLIDDKLSQIKQKGWSVPQQTRAIRELVDTGRSTYVENWEKVRPSFIARLVCHPHTCRYRVLWCWCMHMHVLLTPGTCLQFCTALIHGLAAGLAHRDSARRSVTVVTVCERQS
jgi:hypothetical protein